jgi:hypothetical protein
LLKKSDALKLKKKKKEKRALNLLFYFVNAPSRIKYYKLGKHKSTFKVLFKQTQAPSIPRITLLYQPTDWFPSLLRTRQQTEGRLGQVD